MPASSKQQSLPVVVFFHEERWTFGDKKQYSFAGINLKNGAVKSIIYENGGHASTVAAFSWANPTDLPVKRDIDDFFKQYID